MKKSYWIVALIVAWLVLALVACSPSREKSRKPSEDWSRGVQLGNAVGSIGLAVEGSGEKIHLVWPNNYGAGIYLRYMQLDGSAQVETSQELDFPGQLRTPKLILANEGRLHLFWNSRLPGAKEWRLWYVLLNADGEPLGEAAALSEKEVNVVDYQVATDQHGGAVVSWVDSAQGDLYVVDIDGGGEIIPGPQSINSGVASASVRVDSAGQLYLCWLKESGIYYARMPLDSLHPDEGVLVADVVLGTGTSIDGPVVGFSDGYVYMIWSLLRQSGLEGGTAVTEYVTFPPEEPVKSNPEAVWIFPEEEQPNVSYQGSFALAELSPPPEVAWESSDFILNPSAMILGPEGEFAAALAANQQMRLDQHLQIAAIIYREGRFIGYSFASKTEGISDDPVLTVDEDGNLYLAWREGAGGRHVYYATTNPTAMASLDRLGSGDFFAAVLQGGVEGAVSIALTPVIGFGWMLPGLILMVIWKLFREYESMSDLVSWIPLIVSILLYEAVKFITIPTIITYVPFSAWLAIPLGLEPILRWGVPIAISVIALYVASWMVRRYRSSTILFYIAFTFTDALLTLAVYGVNFLGVF